MRPIGSTVVLTVLIWVYADQITSYTVTEMVPLQVKAQPGADMNVELQEPANGQLEVSFTGPRTKIEDLRKDLSTGKLKADYYVQAEGVTGDTVTRDSLEIINAVLRKDYKMITGADVKPAQVRIFVDPLTTVDMPVKIPPCTTKTTPPIVTPRTVKVTLSDFVYKNLSDGDKYVVLDLENELRNRPEDKEINDSFTLPQMVAGVRVATDPTQVNVKLRILRHLPTKSFEITQIDVMGPADFMARYGVVIQNLQITLELKGLEEDINNLKPQSIQAYLRFEKQDLYQLVIGKTYSRDVQIILPPGITVDGEKMPRMPNVLFKLTDLQPANPAEPR